MANVVACMILLGKRRAWRRMVDEMARYGDDALYWRARVESARREREIDEEIEQAMADAKRRAERERHCAMLARGVRPKASA